MFSLDVDAHPGIWKQIEMIPLKKNKNSTSLFQPVQPIGREGFGFIRDRNKLIVMGG